MKSKKERGQSLVELAISLVVLLYLLSGATEFGLAFFQFVQLRDAAQEGALYGSLDPTNTTEIVSRVRNSSNSPINLSDTNVNTGATVTVNFPDGDACEGNGIQVVVRHDHAIFMPFMRRILSRTSIPLTATVTDTILKQTC